ncbi:MAG: hypothetical protein Q9170_005055 [Blastenia crenularia]
MPIGQNQTLSFRGQATHGGGSCQISLTTDKQPTKQSTWKVINSIDGGCPSNHPGNVGDDPTGYGADKFKFAIPPQIPTGDYTLAWTWFNKIGNREMYMNCAPITVTSASHKHKRSGHRHSAAILPRSNNEEMISKRDSAMASLPDMFVANIGNGCSTAESGTTLAIPQQNMGTIVQRLSSDKLVPPVGTCGGNKAAEPQRQPGASSVVPASSATLASSAIVIPSVASLLSASSATSASSVTPASSASLATSAMVLPSAVPSPSTASTNPSPVPQAPSAASPPAASAAPPPPIPSGLKSGSCPTPGKSLCSPDGMGIGTCDQFNRVIFAPAPLGTKCDPSLGVLVHSKGRMFKA